MACYCWDKFYDYFLTLLNADNNTSATISNLIEDYKHILKSLGNPPIKHVYREVNRVVDWTVKNIGNFCDSFNLCK